MPLYFPNGSNPNLFFFSLDDSKIEAEIKSDMDSAIQKIIPNAEAVEKIINDVLDMQVGQTDMSVRHILTMSVEVILCKFI